MLISNRLLYYTTNAELYIYIILFDIILLWFIIFYRIILNYIIYIYCILILL